MSMFCYQCQETASNEGCTLRGVCGKSPETSNLQDLLIWLLKGLSLYALKAREKGVDLRECGRFTCKALFSTITNANFDDERIVLLIREAIDRREKLAGAQSIELPNAPECALWYAEMTQDFENKARTVGILSTSDEDVRSLRELLIYGLKGIAAYADHAAVLGAEDDRIYDFLWEALASTTRELSVDAMTALVLKAGETAVQVMALLDGANTKAYGHPEITQVDLGTRGRPGILVSGHDLKDLEELLKQTDGTGIDVYSHGEMLPAHYYPAFKKYKNFVGNYGSAWWQQEKDFETFRGPILMTTNCLVPVKNSYRNRIFTTGMTGYPSIPHIADRVDGKAKDFGVIIELAKTCPAPIAIESGRLTGGFAHHQVTALADKVVAAVRSGAIKKFVVMAGCDGRHKSRSYFTDFATALPPDTVILTAGCAKYRYNKLPLGDIGGIPRVLDAGQCNDSYSLAVIALKLKEIFGLADVNDLPIAFDLAWYEQKAVAVLLALLHLGFKNIRLGPSLPAFLSPNVAGVLVKTFGIGGIASVDEDIKALAGC